MERKQKPHKTNFEYSSHFQAPENFHGQQMMHEND